MKLFLFLVFLFIGGAISCQPPEDTVDDKPSLEELDKLGAKCNSELRCKDQCEKWFTGTSSLLKKCLSSPHNDMIRMTQVIAAMERASWKTINETDLSILNQFNESLWQNYAKINNRRPIREMLLWIASTEKIADHLDKENIILKNAFTIMGKTQVDRTEDTAVITGMKQDIDLNTHQHFLEVSALEGTESAFKAAHELLKTECNEQKICMKNFYCYLNTPIVFGALNRLKLGEDVDSDGELSSGECS